MNNGFDAANRDSKRVPEYSRFVADIGGTHARFALVDNSAMAKRNALVEVKVFKCADFSGPAETFIAYQNYLGHSLPDRACIAAAGPVSKGEVRFTNLDWRISAKDLRNELKLKQLEIVNDFTAVAHAVSKLTPSDVHILHPGMESVGGRRVVLGAGTGLGVAGIDTNGGSTRIIDSEGGHARFAPATAEQHELLRLLSRECEFVSMEMLLAGPGIPLIHKALSPIHRLDYQPMDAEEITSHARNRTQESCVKTVDLYTEILASFCSNLALTFGARGGLYLVGEVFRSIEPLFDHRFVNRYLDAGCMTDYVTQASLSLVLVEDPGLRGAAVCKIY